MKIYRGLAYAFAFLGLSAPAHADVQTAALTSAADRPISQATMFAGATFRLGFHRKPNEPRASAALGIGGMTRSPDAAGPVFGRGLELSVEGRHGPSLRVAGADVGEAWQAARLSGGGKALLIATGAAALLGVAALVIVDQARCKEEGRTCD